MVPKVAGKGRSFKGAGLYYLHDKNALTRERVAFTHTENLPTRDPDKAIKCMAWTALRQQELKARSGASNRGRKMADPVYCYSLAWHPDQTPSQEQMIEAAKASLVALGMEEHEALFVGHNDEPHSHIHVVVNRVHPETGIANTLGKDFLRLSTWAQKFEEEHGHIWCEQRVINNERRKNGEFVKDRSSQHAAEFHRWQAERGEANYRKRSIERAGLDIRQERERADLERERDRKIDAKRNQVREATKADWRLLYRHQADQRRDLEKAQANAWSRLRHFVRTHAREFKAADRATRLKMLGNAFSALVGTKRQFVELEKKQFSERRLLGKRIQSRTDELLKTIRAEHAKKLSQLQQKQSHEQHEQQMKHSRESQEQAKEIKDGRDRKQFEKERADRKRRELLEQKADVTKAPPRDASSLREKFRKARDASRSSLADQFRQAGVRDDRSSDQTRDQGRERSRKPKPPGTDPE